MLLAGFLNLLSYATQYHHSEQGFPIINKENVPSTILSIDQSDSCVISIEDPLIPSDFSLYQVYMKLANKIVFKILALQ